MPARLSIHLQGLQNRLGTVLGGTFHKIDHWGAPDGMTKALASVRQAFDSSAVDVDVRSSIIAIKRFRETGRFQSFIDLKYGCFGIGLPIPLWREEWSVIADESSLRRLLKQVDEEREQPRRFRKCYQGLMHSYFSYSIFDEMSETTVENWKILQRYLGNRLEVTLSAKNVPTWLQTLDRHTNLLTSRPCEAYAADLLKGNKKKLLAATEGIGIGAGSWVWQESIVSTAQAVIDIRNDAEFRDKLNSLLDVLEDDSDMTLSESVVVRCLAMALIRYTKCTDRPEHPRLRDMAVHYIGNPWLKRPAWDAYVKNDMACKMVDGWLKRRLITDFFALLSEDGATDERRLNYWLRFEPVIEDMWFALGQAAMDSRSPEFVEIRKRMSGRLHDLSGTSTYENNAFVMKIGALLIVEFSVTNNACYIFNAGDLVVPAERTHLSIFSLKKRSVAIEWLSHMSDWEYKFDNWLCPRLGWHPDKKNPPITIKPAAEKPPKPPPKPRGLNWGGTEIKKHFERMEIFTLIHESNLKYEDNRGKGGAFWIMAKDNDLKLNQSLLILGFKYKPPKGWWRE